MADHSHAAHRHERTDAPVRTIIPFATTLVTADILSRCLTVSYFMFLESGKDPPPPISITSPPRDLPPGPRLQANAPAELRQLRAREDYYLSQSAWVDK